MTVLKDTSLCAIVRDEKMNPAGGVERFLRCHLPYVEEAVVVDTGSTDGTREVLDQMAQEFAHLKVYSSYFGSYFVARNVSLKKVQTKWALVLDADELVEPKSFEVISESLESNSILDGFSLALKNIHFNAEETEPSYNVLHNPRLFNMLRGFRYFPQGRFAEYLYNSRGSSKICETGNTDLIPKSSPILHFKPSNEGTSFKIANWYNQVGKTDVDTFGPAQTNGFSEWKKLNPHRANYPG